MNELLSTGTSKHKLDYTFFDQIDSEEKAYWLGFIAADGSINKNYSVLSIGLAIKDKDHLLKFRSALQSDHTIYTIPPRNNSGSVSLYISSIWLVRSLERHGIINNKSFTLEWPSPSSLPHHLERHFMRGYVDGDGGLYAREAYSKKYQKNHIEFIFSVVGNTSFCSYLQHALIKECGLAYTDFVATRTPGIVQVVYCGGLQVERIFHYLYDDATIWLDRKRSRIEAALMSRPRIAGRQRMVLPIDEICQRYIDGEGLKTIGDSLGVSKTIIKRTVQEAGVELRGSGWPNWKIWT